MWKIFHFRSLFTKIFFTGRDMLIFYFFLPPAIPRQAKKDLERLDWRFWRKRKTVIFSSAILLFHSRGTNNVSLKVDSSAVAVITVEGLVLRTGRFNDCSKTLVRGSTNEHVAPESTNARISAPLTTTSTKINRGCTLDTWWISSAVEIRNSSLDSKEGSSLLWLSVSCVEFWGLMCSLAAETGVISAAKSLKFMSGSQHFFSSDPTGRFPNISDKKCG